MAENGTWSAKGPALSIRTNYVQLPPIGHLGASMELIRRPRIHCAVDQEARRIRSLYNADPRGY